MRRCLALGTVALLTVMVSSCAQLGQIHVGTAEQNKDVVARFIAAVNQRQLDRLDSLVHQDVVRHSQATPDVQVRSLEEFKQFLQRDFATFPDIHQEIERMIAEGDTVAVYVTLTGTQEGPIGPYPPTGKRMEIQFLGMLRLQEGKIAEIWVEWDNLAILSQLGHFPPSE